MSGKRILGGFFISAGACPGQCRPWENQAAHARPFAAGLAALLMAGSLFPAAATGIPAPPEGLSATTHLTGQVVVTWEPVADATAYTVYRYSINRPADAVQIAQTPNLSHSDTPNQIGAAYYYWVSASNALGASALSAPVTGWRSFAIPGNVTSEIGAHTDKARVVWATVSSATAYKVFRNASSDTATAQLIHTTPTGLTAHYDDTFAVTGTIYWYWVKAASQVSSIYDGPFSAPTTGGRAPAPPVSLTASNGAYTDKTRLEWPPVPGATYRLYRGTSADIAAATNFASAAASPYDDTGLPPGVTHYYWVKSRVGDIDSAPTPAAIGGRAHAVPSGLAASNGTFTDKVSLSWQPVPGAASYKVYRYTGTNPQGATLAATCPDPRHDDKPPQIGVVLYYWVKAAGNNAALDSVYSAQATGGRALTAPATVAAGRGGFTDRVRVSWSSVANVYSYKVYRADLNDVTAAKLIHTTANGLTLQYDDVAATVGVYHQYWVKACPISSTYDSVPGGPARGWLDAPATTGDGPVPHWWLDQVCPGNDGEAGTYEALANLPGHNGLPLWQSYVAGLDPWDPCSVFSARIDIVDGTPSIKWQPDLKDQRDYTVWRNAALDTNGWATASIPEARFFKVMVELPARE